MYSRTLCEALMIFAVYSFRKERIVYEEPGLSKDSEKVDNQFAEEYVRMVKWKFK